MGNFRKLKAWQLAQRLSVEIYSLIRTLPSDERYGLRAQISRAEGSIPANIAEGCGRESDAELFRFLAIALGSAEELESHLDRAAAAGLIAGDTLPRFFNNLRQLQAMIVGLRRKIRPVKGL